MRELTITPRLTNRETESFKKYLREVADIKLFTPEEQQICSEKAASGDEEATQELIKHNLRFVISVAKQYVNNNNSLEDLVNEGNIGLMMAVKHFDPKKGFKFISYAVWWIRKVILEYLAKNGRFIRLPANKINDLSKLEKKVSQLEQKLGREADISEIIEEFGDEMDEEDTTLVKILSSFNVGSLDRVINKDDSEADITLLDLIADDSALDTDHLIVNDNVKREINSILSTLDPIEKRIMVASYGLDGGSPMTLSEIGGEENLSRERIRQIKKSTLKHLGKKLKNNSIRYHQ